jgi:GntR family transcriptional regulator, rspAB operon transcriptional repressor
MAKSNLKNTSTYDKAYDFIKERILNMTYKPGQSISEVKIAEELGISRTPVREAINRLISEGLIIHSLEGKIVYTLSLQDIKEIFDIKEYLEAMIAEQVAEYRTDEDVEKLQDIIHRMTEAASKSNVDAWLQVDEEFHALLYDIVGNQRARQIINNLNEQWHRIRIGLIALEQRTKISVEEHKKIADYIIEGNSEKAGKAMREHLSKVRKTLVTLIKNIVIPYVGENM